jgi:hypothetical protein
MPIDPIVWTKLQNDLAAQWRTVEAQERVATLSQINFDMLLSAKLDVIMTQNRILLTLASGNPEGK